MGTYLFNIRFGCKHLILTRDYKVIWRTNAWWVDHKPDKWFVIYDLFGNSLNVHGD